MDPDVDPKKMDRIRNTVKNTYNPLNKVCRSIFFAEPKTTTKPSRFFNWFRANNNSEGGVY